MNYARTHFSLAQILLLACGGVFAQSPQTTAPGFFGTSWRLVKFQGSDDKTLTPDDGNQYTLAFGADGNLSARIDCNRGCGKWQSSGPNQLQLGPLVLSPAPCARLGHSMIELPKTWPLSGRMS